MCMFCFLNCANDNVGMEKGWLYLPVVWLQLKYPLNIQQIRFRWAPTVLLNSSCGPLKKTPKTCPSPWAGLKPLRATLGNNEQTLLFGMALDSPLGGCSTHGNSSPVYRYFNTKEVFEIKTSCILIFLSFKVNALIGVMIYSLIFSDPSLELWKDHLSSA